MRNERYFSTFRRVCEIESGFLKRVPKKLFLVLKKQGVVALERCRCSLHPVVMTAPRKTSAPNDDDASVDAAGAQTAPSMPLPISEEQPRTVIELHQNIPLEDWQVEELGRGGSSGDADSGVATQEQGQALSIIPITSPDAHVIYVNLPEGSSGKLPPDRPEKGVYFR